MSELGQKIIESVRKHAAERPDYVYDNPESEKRLARVQHYQDIRNPWGMAVHMADEADSTGKGDK